MELTNEQKAKEICGCSNCYHNFKGNDCLKDDGILCSTKPCLKDTLEAMQWKDEQFAIEKQQWIGKVYDGLKTWLDPDSLMVVQHKLLELVYPLEIIE